MRFKSLLILIIALKFGDVWEKACVTESRYCKIGLGELHSFFFIRTSNFDAEAERSYIFWRFEAETFLKMFLNLPGIVFQPISADVTRQTIKEHFLLRYGIKLLAHTGLTCSDATCEMSRQPTLAKFGFKKRIDHRGLQQ